MRTKSEMLQVIGKRTALVLLATLAAVYFLYYAGIRSDVDETYTFGRPCQQCPQTAVDWRTVNVDEITAEQMLDYFLWTNRSSCRLAHDFGGHMMSSPSGFDGQKTMCIEPVQLAPPVGKCLVYSFGIDNDWTFDEAMASYGCQVYSFDPSMKVGDHDHTSAIHFFQMGLSNRDSIGDNGWRLRSLSSIYKMLKSKHGDVVIDYLKMDIEAAEWTIIPQIIESGMMGNVRQLAFEIHLSIDDTLASMRERFRIVRSIEEQGMVRFDSKLNPWFRGTFKNLGVTGPCGYEIAWYNSKFLPANSSVV